MVLICKVIKSYLVANSSLSLFA